MSENESNRQIEEVPSSEWREHVLNRRANQLTALSMVLTLGLIVGGVWVGAPWTFCVAAIVIGLAAHVCDNVLVKAILPRVVKRKLWAMALLETAYWSVPVSVAVYMAGVVLLVIHAIRFGWNAIFN